MTLGLCTIDAMSRTPPQSVSDAWKNIAPGPSKQTDSASRPGYNNNGTVDADNERTLLRARGQVCDHPFYPNPDLDSNDDCMIDASDQSMLEAQYGGAPGPSGTTCSPGQGAECPTAVPEPGRLTLLFFGLAGLALLRFHWRRSRDA